MARRKKNRSVAKPVQKVARVVRPSGLALTANSNSPGLTSQAKRSAILTKRLAFAQSLLPTNRLASSPVLKLNTGQPLLEVERRVSRLTLAAIQLREKKEPAKKQSEKPRDLSPHCKKRPDKNTKSASGSGARKVNFIPWC